MPPPPVYLEVAVVIILNCVLLGIVTFGLLYVLVKLKEISKNLPFWYFFSFLAFAWILVAFPVKHFINIKKHFDVWERYQAGLYTEYLGVVDSVEYRAKGVREISLGKENSFLIDSNRDYCFAFLDSNNGFDIEKNIYLRYVPFSDSTDSSYCVAYVKEI
jgi:hypothetical protein